MEMKLFAEFGNGIDCRYRSAAIAVRADLRLLERALMGTFIVVLCL
jgi:hypothetical protein